MRTQAVKVKDDKEPSKAGAATSGAMEKVGETFQGTREFLHDVRVEMKQVTWPSRDDVTSTTGVVIATVFFFALFLFFVDQGVQRAVQYVFHKFGL